MKAYRSSMGGITRFFRNKSWHPSERYLSPSQRLNGLWIVVANTQKFNSQNLNTLVIQPSRPEKIDRAKDKIAAWITPARNIFIMQNLGEIVAKSNSKRVCTQYFETLPMRLEVVEKLSTFDYSPKVSCGQIKFHTVHPSSLRYSQFCLQTVVYVSSLSTTEFDTSWQLPSLMTETKITEALG